MKTVHWACLVLILGVFPECSSRPYKVPTSVAIIKPAGKITPPMEPQDVAVAYMPIRKKPCEKTVIIIDPGHGGEDFGTHSLGKPRYQEKYLNLSTALLVRNFLQQFGFHVIMTRTDDTFITLDERAEFANKLNPRLFVSIHYNSAPSEEAEGIEVFYYANDDDAIRAARSKVLAQCVHHCSVRNTQAKSRGVKNGNFAVIRKTNMPAILLEGGFLTNASEMEKIKDATYMKSLALAIAQGIQDFLAKDNISARTTN
ncbi:MAG: N-acetylmuramoyl-L-alanine amidase [Parachlamydiaceae bacterium]